MYTGGKIPRPADVRRLLAAAGHVSEDVRPTRRNRGYTFHCSCGFVSEPRALPAEAVSLGVEHFGRVRAALEAEFKSWSWWNAVAELQRRRQHAEAPASQTA